jgi:hypothetical protein
VVKKIKFDLKYCENEKKTFIMIEIAGIYEKPNRQEAQ